MAKKKTTTNLIVHAPHDALKHEEVNDTINELLLEKKAKEAAKKNRGARKFFRILFWPFTAPFLAIRKFKIPLTVKMLLVFSLIFTALLAGYSAFLMTSIAGLIEDNTYLVTVTIVVCVVSVAVFTALTGVLCSWVLSPIRQITTRIDEITAEDLSKRLEPVDTQDELRELTDRINGMLDNLEITFLRQENFIADASHELKTPISVIAGYINLLKRWGSKDEKILQEGIEAIYRESENMRAMVEQLLLLARLGKFSVQKSQFDIEAVLLETIESYKMSNIKGQQIFYRGLETETLIETDKNLMIELVRILVNNAVKYTPKGGKIVVSAAVENHILTLSVADTGVGISADDLPKIFDRFFRCDRARGREAGGTGLGLTIAKSIADTIGGTISVESEVGVGTTFTAEFR